MLLAGIGLLDDPFRAFVWFVAIAVSLLIAITFHEASHAVTALRLGDDTAARLGRVTLNPKRHLDPAGTVILLIAGFGWGKPVPVNPSRLRTGRTGMAMVSAAGPMANVALAVGFALLFRVGVLDSSITRDDLQSLSPMAWASLIAWYGVALNLLLAVFQPAAAPAAGRRRHHPGDSAAELVAGGQATAALRADGAVRAHRAVVPDRRQPAGVRLPPRLRGSGRAQGRLRERGPHQGSDIAS